MKRSQSFTSGAQDTQLALNFPDKRYVQPAHIRVRLATLRQRLMEQPAESEQQQPHALNSIDCPGRKEGS